MRAWKASKRQLTFEIAQETPSCGLPCQVTEELVFRGWFMSASAAAGFTQATTLAASTALFALWHAGVEGGAFGFYVLLGLWFGALYLAFSFTWSRIPPPSPREMPSWAVG